MVVASREPVGYRGDSAITIVALTAAGRRPTGSPLNGGYGQGVRGAGYATKPNYRGSTNYGQAHKTGIVGNYSRRDSTTSDGRGLSHRPRHRRQQEDGSAWMERGRTLVELDSDAHAGQGAQLGSRHVELDLDVTRRAMSANGSSTSATNCSTTKSTRMNQTRSSTSGMRRRRDDPVVKAIRGPETAVGRAAHGAEEDRRT